MESNTITPDAVFVKKDLDIEERKILLEQYRIYTETMQDIFDKTQNVNNFFISINSLILTAIGFFMQKGMSAMITNLGVAITGFVGVILCYEWVRLLFSFRRLQGEKLKVIQAMEAALPARLFRSESKASGLSAAGEADIFLNKEIKIPLLFGLLNGLIIAVVAVNLYFVWHHETSVDAPVQEIKENIQEDLKLDRS